MNYYLYHSGEYSDSIQHALFRHQKGQERPGHKYYLRVPTKYGYRYFYDLDDVKAFLHPYNNSEKKDAKKTSSWTPIPAEAKKKDPLRPKKYVSKDSEGNFQVTTYGKKETRTTYANDKNATLFGNKEARSHYKLSADSAKNLKKTISKTKADKKLTQEQKEEKLKTLNHLLLLNETGMKRLKDEYDRTRTIDEIPDYIITKGYNVLNKILGRR